MAEWVDGKLKITLRDRWKFSRNKVPKRIMQAYDYVCKVLKGPDSDEIDRERRYQIVGCKYGDLPVAACLMREWLPPFTYLICGASRYHYIVFDKGTEFLEEDALVGLVAHEIAH